MPLTAPTRIFRRDNNLVLEVRRMRLGEIDSSGRRRPEPIAGSETTLVFNTIIRAIGQQPAIPDHFDLDTGAANTIQVDPDTLAASQAGVFAGGDAVTGPASVIEAIAAGRQAAISIDQYLGGKGIIEEKLAPPEGEVAPLEITEEKRRPAMPALTLKKRLKGFKQVELGYNTEMAKAEAQRCLRCDLEEHEDEE